MGKGDKKSRRGKIFAGSFGKTRPKRKTAPKGAAKAVATTPAKAKKSTKKS